MNANNVEINNTEWLAERLTHAGSMLPTCIEVNPNKRGGIPVIKGTRFTAAQALAEIADGRSVAELCEDFELDEESVKNLLRALSIYLDRPYIPSTHEDIPTRRVFE